MDMEQEVRIVTASSPEGRRLSSAMWKMDWSRYFPWAPGAEGIRLEVSDYEECARFAAEHFGRIYGPGSEQSPFLWRESGATKRAFYEEAVDCFAYRHDGRTVGIFVINPIDWSSCYLRNASILPEYQGRKLYQSFINRMAQILPEHGVDRLIGEVAPSNQGVVATLTKLGFQVTGLTLSERWGATLQLTKHLNERHWSAFNRQFCHHF